ncbi:MAG TPA: selenoneine synthase SenA [Thermoanaerobaculia bacterium]|nr:selenoneine synthase SenA [Thermoanaerobaculia bacterium]
MIWIETIVYAGFMIAVDFGSELRVAREKTNALWLGLREEQLTLPFLPIVNPILWEAGHVAWFQEYWVLRRLHGRTALMESCDRLYDSAAVEHRTRWSLPLPDRQGTRDYMQRTLDDVLDVAERVPAQPYFFLLSLFHEDMHGEAMMYTRQTVGLPEPEIAPERLIAAMPGPDIRFPGGEVTVGSGRNEPFIFDNEKWAHAVTLAGFRISNAPVSNAEMLEFVEAGSYEDARHWTHEGWSWRLEADAHHPLYWRRRALHEWELRRFDRWLPLPLSDPVVHVNAYEAEAFCGWAGRRLPSEIEWEAAARPAGGKPGFALPNVGLVWEWTTSRFLPYEAFSADPYKEYSEPWFATPHRVLRGGSWATPARMMRPSFRNFYQPHRRDIYAGFRTASTV